MGFFDDVTGGLGHALHGVTSTAEELMGNTPLGGMFDAGANASNGLTGELTKLLDGAQAQTQAVTGAVTGGVRDVTGAVSKVGSGVEDVGAGLGSGVAGVGRGLGNIGGGLGSLLSNPLMPIFLVLGAGAVLLIVTRS